MTRTITNEILGAVEEGLLDRDILIMACLKYMSEDDVADMAHINDLLPEYDDDHFGCPGCPQCDAEEREYDDAPGTACSDACGHCGRCS